MRPKVVWKHLKTNQFLSIVGAKTTSTETPVFICLARTDSREHLFINDAESWDVTPTEREAVFIQLSDPEREKRRAALARVAANAQKRKEDRLRESEIDGDDLVVADETEEVSADNTEADETVVPSLFLDIEAELDEVA